MPPSPTGRSGGGRGDDVRSADRGTSTLAGYVADDFGRKLRGVFIEVVPADNPGSGAPIGVETSDDGSFLIDGVRAGQTYILSAKTTRDGVEMAGEIQTRPPNARLLLSLREGLSLPGSSPRTRPLPEGEDLGTVRPPSGRPRPVPLSNDRGPAGSPQGDSGRSDGSYSPAGPAPLNPRSGSDTPTDRPPGRPELTTEGKQPGFRPPATNIPPPDRTPSVLPAPPEPDLPRSESRSIRPRSEFVLLDTLGRPKEFPTGRAGELVLIEFLTTTCMPCKKAVPALKDLQSRYGAQGLDVIGVVCDEVDTPQRRVVAAAYQRNQDLNYLLYVEPGNDPGRVRDKFGVEFYPTMVLLNGVGDVLWKGDPRNLGPLERVIGENLGK